MSYKIKKTEHDGSKKGQGAYWGYRWDAKRESKKARRANDKKVVRETLKDAGS